MPMQHTRCKTQKPMLTLLVFSMLLLRPHRVATGIKDVERQQLWDRLEPLLVRNGPGVKPPRCYRWDGGLSASVPDCMLHMQTNVICCLLAPGASHCDGHHNGSLADARWQTSDWEQSNCNVYHSTGTVVPCTAEQQQGQNLVTVNL